MGKKVTGQPSTPPMAQPPSAKKTGISSRLAEVSSQISKFIAGRGKSLFRAGKPHEFSGSAPRDSKRVSEAATGSILPSKQTKRK
jgi:hypothetical protein